MGLLLKKARQTGLALYQKHTVLYSQLDLITQNSQTCAISAITITVIEHIFIDIYTSFNNIGVYIFFILKYYKPDIKYKLIGKINKIANTSIDISDGLIADMNKLINDQKLSYKIFLNKIPISKNLSKIISIKKLSKIKLISNGDDYEIMFTARKSKRLLIKKISKNLNLKITRIGIILKDKQKSCILSKNNKRIMLKNKGYFHKF